MDQNLGSALMSIQLDEHMGLDIGGLPIAGSRPPLDLNGYWQGRRNDRIYLMSLLFAHYFCRRRTTVADIGCHCSPLVLMIPGFDRRYAIDPSPEAARAWAHVDGATFINSSLEAVNVESLIGVDDKFDLIMCNQVIEHLDDPVSFARGLLESARRVIISTTFETPAGVIPGHVQDPIGHGKFLSWFPRKPLLSSISYGKVGAKIVAVF